MNWNRFLDLYVNWKSSYLGFSNIFRQWTKDPGYCAVTFPLGLPWLYHDRQPVVHTLFHSQSSGFSKHNQIENVINLTLEWGLVL